jgi:hypothetical protein
MRPDATRRGRAGLLVVALCCFASLMSACAVWQAPGDFDRELLRTRSVSACSREVQVRATVLGRADSLALFGFDITGQGVQPVWIEVENRSAEPLWLLRSGSDPNYFSPLEVAWSFHRFGQAASNQRIDRHFDDLGFANPIPAESSRAGILFSNPERHTKLLNLDLVGERRLLAFTLFPPVPDSHPDARPMRSASYLVAASPRQLHSLDALRAELAAAPAFADTSCGASSGFPVNAVLIGTLDDVAAALVRRGYRVDQRARDRSQALFGRSPDIVLRKSLQGGAPANWLRVWQAAFGYQGQPVFLAQAGRPQGGRFGDGNRPDHPDADEARNLLVQDLIYSEGLFRLGFVASNDRSPDATTDCPAAHRPPPGPEPMRAVMFFSKRPMALADIEILDWDPLPGIEP